MSLFYYPSFEIVTTDTDGYPYPLSGETVDVNNITQSTSLGTLTADANGIILEGTYDEIFDGVLLYDTIEITHATLSGSARFVLQETEEKAFSAAENDVLTLVLDNSFTDTIEPETVNVFAVDLDAADAVPVFIGQAKVGVATKFQYKQTKAQNLRVYTAPLTDSFAASANDLSKLPFADVVIPGIADEASRRLYQYYADVESNSGFALDVDAYTSEIEADTLEVNGDTLYVQYSGQAAKNSNTKAVRVKFAGVTIFDTGDINDVEFGDWHVTAHIIRVDETTARSIVSIHSGIDIQTIYTEISTGLDFSTAEDLILVIFADTADSDNVAKTGTVDYMPANSDIPADVLLGGGIELTGGGVYLTS